MEDKTTLRKRLYELFSEFYDQESAEELAILHVDSHPQCLNVLRRNRLTHKTVKPKSIVIKKPTWVRETQCEKMQKVQPIRRIPNLNPDVVDEEVLSFMRSVDATRKTPIKMIHIVNGCSGFGWSYAQIRLSVRRLHVANKIVQHGNFKSAEYSLPPRLDVPSEILAERFQTYNPTDSEPRECERNANC